MIPSLPRADLKLSADDWRHNDAQPVALGCANCFLRATCGGLQVDGGALDCQRFCCKKMDCDLVWFNAPERYASRFHEIGGFDLDNISRSAPVHFDRWTGYAPLIHHAYCRLSVYSGDVVALSLYELLDRDGKPKYSSREELARNFRIREDAKLVISGVHKDNLLERFWRSRHRREVARFLTDLQVEILTSPNFSTYINVPRPENLYNIKRIGLISSELLGAGIPIALHINGCTDADYDRYARFLRDRTEFEAISSEFITGAKAPSRLTWHVEKLLELAADVGRPLQLVIRGGMAALNALASGFDHIMLIDSSPLQKAVRRQRLVFGNDGTLRQFSNPLKTGQPVDELLEFNAKSFARAAAFSLRTGEITRQRSIRSSVAAEHADNETGQLNLLTDERLGKHRAATFDGERVIAASESQ